MGICTTYPVYRNNIQAFFVCFYPFARLLTYLHFISLLKAFKGI